MDNRVKILIIMIAFFFFMFISKLLKRKKIDFKYALAWSALVVVIVILTLTPGLLEWISQNVGIASPVNMLFFFGFCLALCMIFSLSITVSHLNDRVKKLTQELAILKKTMYEESLEIKQRIEDR